MQMMDCVEVIVEKESYGVFPARSRLKRICNS